MPRTLSLNARAAFNAQQTDEVLVVLVEITHEDLEETIRLSSDPTTRLSTDPLRYGTIHQGNEYEFVLMRAIWPDDREGSPPGASLAFENVAADMASIVRSITSPARVDLLAVLASSPDHIEEAYRDLRTSRATYDAGQIVIDITRELVVNEPWPAHRMTQNRFPGLFR